MIRILTSISAIALVTALSACGKSDVPAENVSAMNDMNMMMADADNVFAESEMKMDQAMATAIGINAGDSWVRKMIEHHRGAVDMSRIVLGQSATADVAKMAQSTIDKQGKEITDLEKLIAAGTPDAASAELYRPASVQMQNAMMAAKGTDVSDTYLRKMLQHHKGAVAMSDVALANGATGAVRAQIETTKAGQQKEIGMVEAMLRGEPMMSMDPAPGAAMTSTSTPTKTAPKAASRPAAAAKPPLAPAKSKPSERAADPHAGMDMNKM
ncbi:MAG: DUF305 domain-containing protein [Sphingosinicella sp.]|nr:DUF305 domain-containing protein [Sphingosinicella sp.]